MSITEADVIAAIDTTIKVHTPESDLNPNKTSGRQHRSLLNLIKDFFLQIIDTKINIEAATTTGTALTFLTDRVYGSEASPATGNITANITGAKLGVTNLIIHNAGSEPTFDSKFHKLSGSGDYVLGVKNYIYCQYLSATRIVYTISQ
jgi:hypothetical protein